MRQILSFICESAQCAATLDAAEGSTGLFIVSGGNEIRIGSHRGMAKLAADVAAVGHPVFRYDRRGVGDSEGENLGFEASAADMAAALEAFHRAQPQLERVVAFGNCDAATALFLNRPAGIDGLVLGNPWLVEPKGDEPAPAAARAYYWARLRDKAAWMKLLRGGVNLRGSLKSLSSAAKAAPLSPLAERVAQAIEVGAIANPIPTRILLAAHDGTAITFADQWARPLFDTVRDDIRLRQLSSASHSFALPEDYAMLLETVLGVLTSL